MIITRSPLRISIGGGGTDLRSYYRHRGGFLIAMAIDHHVYVSLGRRFDRGFLLKYSQIERGESLDEIRHPIIREALKMMNVREIDIEITSVADVPAGTGLGSSSTFTTALLRALAVFQRRHMDTRTIAQMACDLEIDRLGEPIGKQDQYIAAFGGLTAFRFNEDDSVDVETLDISDETYDSLRDNLLMFFAGGAREAGTILKEQNEKSQIFDHSMLANLDRVKELGYRTREAFISGKLDQWGEIMLEHWQAKKRRSSSMSNPQIDEWYDLGLRNGAIGGKLVGAGGGGFLLFYARDPTQLRSAMKKAGLKEMRVRMDLEGAKVLTTRII
jgi:D-glycero-alpha-D-manno-heptose-7-phosphate kinase